MDETQRERDVRAALIALLGELEANGVNLELKGDQVRISGPAHIMRPVMSAILASKTSENLGLGRGAA